MSNFLKKNVLHAFKTNRIKCFKNNSRVDIKNTKGINHLNFLNDQSVVSNNFYQIDGSNKHLKRYKAKNLKKATFYNID